MSKESEAKCPCCGARIEYFPDQDGACDYYCAHCGWREHVPSSEDIAVALSRHEESQPGNKPSLEPQLLAAGEIDLELLKRQAAILGKIVDSNPLTNDERSCLEGLWEFVHRVIDCIPEP